MVGGRGVLLDCMNLHGHMTRYNYKFVREIRIKMMWDPKTVNINSIRCRLSEARPKPADYLVYEIINS